MPNSTFVTQGTQVGFVKPSRMSINIPFTLIIYARSTGTITPYCTLTFAHGSYIHCTITKVKLHGDYTTLY